jgi:tRNA dimethylallyltransferase
LEPLSIVGPTASGKTQVSVALAHHIEALVGRPVEIISADSMQVYRGMDVGTGKATMSERQGIAHHLIDVVDPVDEFDVASFQALARASIADIQARGAIPLLVGGTGLYHQAVVDNFRFPPQFPAIRAELEHQADVDPLGLFDELRRIDPLAASRMEPTNRRRIVRALEVCRGSGEPFSQFGPGVMAAGATRFRILGISTDRDRMKARISTRLADQFRGGFIEEVAQLHERWGPLSTTAGQALGYGEIHRALAAVRFEPTALDEAAVEALRADIALRTHRFAVRQLRWFRRDSRITWLDAEDPAVVDRMATLWAG